MSRKTQQDWEKWIVSLYKSFKCSLFSTFWRVLTTGMVMHIICFLCINTAFVRWGRIKWIKQDSKLSMDIHSSCRVSCVWRFPPFMLLRMGSTLQLWPYRNRHKKNPAYGHSPICIQVLRFRCRLQGTLYMMWSFYYCCSVAKKKLLGSFYTSRGC